MVELFIRSAQVHALCGMMQFPSRTVVIPPGIWRGDDGSVVTGPTTIVADAPLSRLPHYIRR